MKEIEKKSHNKKKVKRMKIKKIIITLVILLIIYSVGFSLYIGNYVYNYTLNPLSKHYLGEKIIQQESSQSQQWLYQNSEQVKITSFDHLKLKARLVHNQSDVYIIMVHGYRGNGASIISPIKKMKANGYNLLIPDLRGHGESEGNYIGMGWDERKDILQWIDFLIERNSNASIVLYGVSMGAATVMNVSGEKLPHQVKAIIEDCGYTNVWDLFQSHLDLNTFQSLMAFYGTSFVTRWRAGYAIEDNQPIKQVQKSQVPMLFIHGSDDDFVPSWMVEQLYEHTYCVKEKLIVEGAGHANSCATNAKLYYQTIFHFIEKYT